MQKIIYSFLFGLGCICIQAQKFRTISSDFSILEKNTKTDSSFLVVGQVEYDLYEDKTVYSVNFPETKTWEFADSIMTIYDSLYKVVSVDTIGTLNEMSVFKKILRDELSDFGLTEAGFVISEVQKAENSVLFKWTPPAQFDFIKEIISKKDDNNLAGLIIIDEDGKAINQTFYEDYIYVKDLPVPTRIKSHFKGEEEQIFKELQFRNIEIE